MTTIILTYYQNRLKYLPGIIESLKNQTVKTDIVIFNQGAPISLEDKSVTLINSGRNYGCAIRHALALVIDDDVFMFQDDDLILEPDAIEIMQKHLTDTNVTGIDGRLLRERNYHSVKGVYRKTAPADIIVGRAHMTTKSVIASSFELREKLGLKIWREDDIMLSLPAAGNMVVNAWHTNLDEEGIGLCYEPTHVSDRDKVVESICNYLNIF